MRITPSRTILIAACAVVGVLAGPGAGLAQVGPPATTTTLAPTTTAATTPAPTETTVAAPPTTAPQTMIIPFPGDSRPTEPAAPTTATTARTGGAPAATPAPAPAASLSPGQAEAFVRDQQRTAASSTAALIEALRPLQSLGMTATEALALGMGRFPVLGLANWNDDWLDYRAGPPVHAHQGTDVFAAFDTPVRSPVDGTVRFEDSGLGGKGVFVTAPDGTYYYMAHLNGFNPELGNGSAVRTGQVVAYNGDSGNAKGGAPHVHFEVHPKGGAAVNPKPFLDDWLAAALAEAPALVASMLSPPPGEGDGAAEGGVPQILVTTGLTRRFSTPTVAAPRRERRVGDFNQAVLGPLTPPALARLIAPGSDR